MAKTKRSGKGWSTSELNRFWEGLQSIKDNPDLMKALNQYLAMVFANQEGRLTPEEVERLERLNEFIHCTHQLHCADPKPTPEQAQSLENRIKELSQGASVEGAGLGGAA